MRASTLTLFTLWVYSLMKSSNGQFGFELNKQDLIDYVKDLDFGTLEGKTKNGKGSYEVKNIEVRSFDLEDISLKPVGNALRAAVTDASGALDGNYKAELKAWLFKLKSKGKLTAKFSKVSIAASITLTTNGEIKLVNCVQRVGDVKARVSDSGIDWLLNIFISLFDKRIKEEISKAMCPALTKAISKQSPKIMKLLG